MTNEQRIFDAHFHLIAPTFPLIVSGSFQQFDQGYLLAALNHLGPSYTGVINLPANTEDDEIIALYKQGVKGVRFNLYRGGSETIDHLLDFAKRIYELCGMHIELYISGEQISEHFALLKQLPKYSIDHLGLTKAGLPSLLKLVENGARVKATGFMRVDFDPLARMQQIHGINPNALMFGTDLPGTRASRLFNQSDLTLIQEHFSQSDHEKILLKNALDFYSMTI